MTNPITRRTLLTALPASGVALALPSIGLPAIGAEPIDKHPYWLGMYNKSREMWLEAPEGSKDAEDLWAIGDRWRNLIAETVALTNAGLRAQMEFFICDMADYEAVRTHETLARNVLRGLS